MKFEVRWEPELMDFYKYGSTIEFFGSNQVVYFKNEILSPGSTIMSWHSQANHQGSRTLLQLPLLKRGKTYDFEVEAETFPRESLLVQIEFHDRMDQVIGRQVIFGYKGSFIYPQKTFSYSLKLINNGIEELFFKKIVIGS